MCQRAEEEELAEQIYGVGLTANPSGSLLLSRRRREPRIHAAMALVGGQADDARHAPPHRRRFLGEGFRLLLDALGGGEEVPSRFGEDVSGLLPVE